MPDQVLTNAIRCSVGVGEAKRGKYLVLGPRLRLTAYAPEENSLSFRREPPVPVRHLTRQRLTSWETQNGAGSALLPQDQDPSQVVFSDLFCQDSINCVTVSSMQASFAIVSHGYCVLSVENNCR